MNYESAPIPELDALVESWCEGLLTSEDAARLEQLVCSHPSAMDRYLAYVALHGTLHWDTAAGAEEIRDATHVTMLASRKESENEPVTSGTKHRWSRRRLAMAATTLVTAVLLAALALMPGQPFVNRPLEQASNPQVHPPEHHPDEDPLTTESIVGGDSTPIVRLDRGAVPHDASPHPEDTDASTNTRIPRQPARSGDLVAYINDEIEAAWRENDVIPSAPADDAEWLRRISLDLTGRIQAIDEVTAFLADENPRKRMELIEELLEGEQYARHFTTVWANLLVGRGMAKREERQGLEQFLVHRFRRNLPWNETVAELVSAEGTLDENGATGYLLAHLNNEAVPATAITARLFLCQQVQCTQCHKHPWNDWTQEQFWELNSFFQQTGIDRRTVVDKETGQTRMVAALTDRQVGGPTYFEDLRGIMQVAYPRFDGEAIDPGADVDRRQELARILGGEDHLQLARAMVNRMWAHFFGYGFTNPIDDMGPHQTLSHPALLERLSQEFVSSGYDVAQLIRWITASQAYQLSSRRTSAETSDAPETGDPARFSRMYLKPLSPEQLYDSLAVLTQTDQDSAQSWLQLTAARQEWLQQFFEVLENEENGELSTFDGSLPQALLMMNGPLIQRAASLEAGGVLRRIVSSRSSDVDKIRQLSLAVLSREPTERELNSFRRHLQQAKSRAADPRTAANEALRDVFWVYLNSSEFVVNH